MRHHALKVTIGKVGGIRQTLLGTRRVKKESGHTLTRRNTVRHRTEVGDRECNIVAKRDLGQEMDIGLESMEAGP